MRPTAPLAALAAAFLLSSGAAAALLPQGPPVALDGPLDCGNGEPALARFAVAGGGFVAVWSDGATLSARELDATGQPSSAARALATGHPRSPEVVVFHDRSYAVAWYDPERAQVLARFVAADGVAGPEVVVAGAEPDPGFGFGGLDAAAGPGGATLAIVWTDGATVFLRELRADGTGVSPPFPVESYLDLTGFRTGLFTPVVLTGLDGAVRVFWVVGSAAPEVSREGSISGRRVVRAANPGGYDLAGQIFAGLGHDPEAALGADGSYLLAWAGRQTTIADPPPPDSEGPIVESQLFDADDRRRGEPVRLDPGPFTPSAAVSVAASPLDGFAVAWQAQLPGAIEGLTTTLGVDLGPLGQPAGAPRPLAPPESAGQAAPDLAFTADGELVAAWQEIEDPTIVHIVCPGERIRVRRYAVDCAGEAVCVGGGRFEIAVEYFDPRRGLSGSGRGAALTGDTAYFWFFAADRVEVVAKVIDGRAVNGHFWFYWGGLTDLGLRITLHDRLTGATRSYESAPGAFASAGDVAALAGGESFTVARLDAFGLDREAVAADAAVAPSEVAAILAASLPHAAAGASTSAAGPCSPPALPVVPRPGLCLAGERFEVEATWHAGGRSGAGEGVELGDESGYLWFFAPDNVELMIKVLDGRALNGNFWVFYAALTNLEYDLVVRHFSQHREWRRHNPAGGFGSGGDVDTLRPPTATCVCPAVYEPVCGRDGRTYDNACWAGCVGWVGIAHEGRCTTP